MAWPIVSRRQRGLRALPRRACQGDWGGGGEFAPSLSRCELIL